MAKTYLEKLGLKPVNKLTKGICRERVTHLRSLVKREKVKGKLRDRAVYYANWYGWVAQHGGSRAKKRA